MLGEQLPRSSLQVAPLAITKSTSSAPVYHASTREDDASRNHPYHKNNEMTPPATPHGSQEDLSNDSPLLSPPVFHNYLRAFYPFHPSYAMTDSAVTLPLNEGDVVLVHSIHTNGWADGTLLGSGARGWLPTNYCYAYDPDEMRNLLKALLNFWDLLRSACVDDSEIFANQEFMKGVIAGVRYLLVGQFAASNLPRSTNRRRRRVVVVAAIVLTDHRAGTDKLSDAGVCCDSATRRLAQGQKIPALRTVLLGKDG